MLHSAEKWMGRVNELKNDLTEYLEAKFQLLALKGIESLTSLLTMVIQKITTLIFSLLALLFLMIAAAFQIGEWLDSTALGFALIALPFLILGIYFHHTRSKTLSSRIEKELFDAFQPLFQNDKKETE